MLNDSGRMNHSAEVDGAFFKPPIIFFLHNSFSVLILHMQWVSWCFIKVWLIKSLYLILNSQVLQMRYVKRWSHGVPTYKYSSAVITSYVHWNAYYIMLFNDASLLCYLAHFLHYKLLLLIMNLMSEKCDKLQWNTVWVFRLSCTLAKNIDLISLFIALPAVVPSSISMGAFYGDKCIWSRC